MAHPRAAARSRSRMRRGWGSEPWISSRWWGGEPLGLPRSRHSHPRWVERLAARGSPRGTASRTSLAPPPTPWRSPMRSGAGRGDRPAQHRLNPRRARPAARRRRSSPDPWVDPSFPDRRSLEGERPRPPSTSGAEPTAAILFTSGTTGRPKAAALARANLLAAARASALNIGGSPSDRWLLTLPALPRRRAHHAPPLRHLRRGPLPPRALRRPRRQPRDRRRRRQPPQPRRTTIRRLLDAPRRPPVPSHPPRHPDRLEDRSRRRCSSRRTSSRSRPPDLWPHRVLRPGHHERPARRTASPPARRSPVSASASWTPGRGAPSRRRRRARGLRPTSLPGYLGDESETHQTTLEGLAPDSRPRLARRPRETDRGRSPRGPDHLRRGEHLPGGGGGGAARRARRPRGCGLRARGRASGARCRSPPSSPAPASPRRAADRHCRAQLAGYKSLAATSPSPSSLETPAAKWTAPRSPPCS